MPLINLEIRENTGNTPYHLRKVEEKRKWTEHDSLGKGRIIKPRDYFLISPKTQFQGICSIVYSS